MNKSATRNAAKPCKQPQTATRKPAAHKPVVHRDYHITGLPKSFEEAKSAGWTFRVLGNTKGMKPYAKVGVACTSPDGKRSMLFPSVCLGETFISKEPEEQVVLHRARKPGLSPVEQAKKKAARAAHDAEVRRAMKGTGGSKPQASSVKKPKDKK